MHLKETLLFIILVYTSYLFLLKFSKDENEELITALQVQNHVECPTGITLYRLKSGSYLYRVQVQSKLPHDPAVTFKILKRCETFELDERGQGNDRVIDKSAARHSPVEANDYEKIGLSLSYLVDEACKKQDYTTQECGLTSNGSGLVSRITASYPFMAYLLEVVKGFVVVVMLYWAVTRDFQQCGILTSVDSYEHNLLLSLESPNGVQSVA